MSFFHRYINSYKWSWYVITLIGSLVPMIIRFIISLDSDISMFDIKDLIFAGLAMNLSNLNLIGKERFTEKENIANTSALFIIFLASFLGIFFYAENPEVKSKFVYLKAFSAIFTLASIWVSYQANNFVFKKVD